MRRVRQLLERLRSGDSGLSLMELIVAMTLLAILMTIIISMYSAFTTNFTRDRSSTDSTNVASIGINEVTRVIRAGTEIEVLNSSTNKPVFVIAARERLVMHAYLDTNAANPAPILVEFSIGATSRVLNEKRWAGTKTSGYWGFPSPTTTPVTDRVIARKIVAPASGQLPLFTYLKTEGCATGTTCAIVPTSGNALSAAEIAQVVAVQVTMVVQADETGRADPVTIINRVGIPNLGKSRVGL